MNRTDRFFFISNSSAPLYQIRGAPGLSVPPLRLEDLDRFTVSSVKPGVSLGLILFRQE